MELAYLAPMIRTGGEQLMIEALERETGAVSSGPEFRKLNASPFELTRCDRASRRRIGL